MKKVENINFSCFRLNLFAEFKHHYLCALSHLLQWIPKQVLLSEVPNVSIFCCQLRDLSLVTSRSYDIYG